MRKLFDYITRLVGEFRAWNGRSRDRRVAAFSGLPLDGQPLPAPVIGFEFPLEEIERIKQIEDYVKSLGPDGLDEGTGDVLDRLVDAHILIWTALLHKKHSKFLADAALRFDQVRAVAEQYAILHDYDCQRLIEAETTVEHVLFQVLGSDDPYPAPEPVAPRRPSRRERRRARRQSDDRGPFEQEESQRDSKEEPS